MISDNVSREQRTQLYIFVAVGIFLDIRRDARTPINVLLAYFFRTKVQEVGQFTNDKFHSSIHSSISSMEFSI